MNANQVIFHDEHGEHGDAADAVLAGALREHFGELPPDLSAAILERTGHAHPRRVLAVPAQRRMSWAAAAVVVLGAGAVFAVGMLGRSSGAPAQEPQKPFWSFDPGTTWVYAVERDGVTEGRTFRVTTSFPVQPKDAKEVRTVGQLLVQDGNGIGFQYFGADANGIYRYPAGHIHSLPGLDADATVARLLALPLGIETRWDTDEQQWQTLEVIQAGGGAVAGGLGGGKGGGGAFAGPVGARSKRVVEHKHCELVEPSVRVRVPAGEFACAHVRLTTDGEGAKTVEDLWLSPGTGLVRRVLEQDGKAVETTELKSFTPGKPDPDAGAVLAKFLQRDAGVTEYGPVQETVWVEQAPRHLRLRSRFAVVRFADKQLTFCVRGSTVKPFDAGDAEQWTAVVKEEGMTRWNDNLLPQARGMALVDLAARIRAAQKGLLVDANRNPEWSFRVNAGGGSCHYQLGCTDAGGTAQTVTVDLTVGSDDRVKVAYPE